MDLGLKARNAIICASSRGLGKACATALAREGCSVVVNGRNAEQVEATAAEIRAKTGASVTAMAADLTTEQGRASLVATRPNADILVTNNGGPPPGRFEDWSHADWLAALEANMLAPIFMIKALLPGMRSRRFGRIVNITSARVKTPTEASGLSTAARTGLTGLCKGLAIEVARDNVTINNLLPERILTDRQRYMAERMMEEEGICSAEAFSRMAKSLPARRLGTPEEFADTCAFLCGTQAGFISGQNLSLDGASYRGLV